MTSGSAVPLDDYDSELNDNSPSSLHQSLSHQPQHDHHLQQSIPSFSRIHRSVGRKSHKSRIGQHHSPPRLDKVISSSKHAVDNGNVERNSTDFAKMDSRNDSNFSMFTSQNGSISNTTNPTNSTMKELVPLQNANVSNSTTPVRLNSTVSPMSFTQNTTEGSFSSIAATQTSSMSIPSSSLSISSQSSTFTSTMESGLQSTSTTVSPESTVTTSQAESPTSTTAPFESTPSLFSAQPSRTMTITPTPTITPATQIISTTSVTQTITTTILQIPSPSTTSTYIGDDIVSEVSSANVAISSISEFEPGIFSTGSTRMAMIFPATSSISTSTFSATTTSIPTSTTLLPSVTSTSSANNMTLLPARSGGVNQSSQPNSLARIIAPSILIPFFLLFLLLLLCCRRRQNGSSSKRFSQASSFGTGTNLSKGIGSRAATRGVISPISGFSGREFEEVTLGGNEPRTTWGQKSLLAVLAGAVGIVGNRNKNENGEKGKEVYRRSTSSFGADDFMDMDLDDSDDMPMPVEPSPLVIVKNLLIVETTSDDDNSLCRGVGGYTSKSGYQPSSRPYQIPLNEPNDPFGGPKIIPIPSGLLKRNSIQSIQELSELDEDRLSNLTELTEEESFERGRIVSDQSVSPTIDLYTGSSEERNSARSVNPIPASNSSLHPQSQQYKDQVGDVGTSSQQNSWW